MRPWDWREPWFTVSAIVMGVGLAALVCLFLDELLERWNP